ncbi:MAG: molecular chaperone TorD family protein [Anaerolineales bacterium]
MFVNSTLPLEKEQINRLNELCLYYAFLNRIFFEKPDRAFIDELIAGEVMHAFPLSSEQSLEQAGKQALRAFAAANAGGLSEETFESLKKDYQRLFVGPGHLPAPPWESVYRSREHLVFEKETLDVRRWYARYGLQAPKLNKEPDDHIGLEFAFLLHLTTLALQNQADQEACADLLRAQRAFIEEHLVQWAPSFFQAVSKHAATDFYRGIGYLGSAILDEVASDFEVRIPEVQEYKLGSD